MENKLKTILILVLLIFTGLSSCSREENISQDNEINRRKSMHELEYDNHVFVPEHLVEEFKLRIQRYQEASVASNSEIGRKFYSLLIGWYKCMFNPKIMVSSHPKNYLNCEQYHSIVQLGRPALPLIIDNMRKGDIFLWDAVREITRVNLVDPNESLTDQDISKLYIGWWDTKGKKDFEVN